VCNINIYVCAKLAFNKYKNQTCFYIFTFSHVFINAMETDQGHIWLICELNPNSREFKYLFIYLFKGIGLKWFEQNSHKKL
jgi:hypothetical protein